MRCATSPEVDDSPTDAPNSVRRWAALTALVALFACFLALGIWQIERRAWKLDLIARVDAHRKGPAVEAPGPLGWLGIGKLDEYRRLSVSGTFHHELETCTQAVTVRGPGCWVITPLQTAAGWWILINRGFVDPEHRDAATRPAGQVAGRIEVSGLLRLSEPHGGFLRANEPLENRWTSRDVEAIAGSKGLPLALVAPYFLDAERSDPGGPVGGLTIVKFRNTHLAYALTWFGLAGLTVLGAVFVVRHRSPA